MEKIPLCVVGCGHMGQRHILAYKELDDSGSEILPVLPRFEMSEITERVFGKDAVTYDLPSPAIDAKHMAIEFHDFGEAVLKDRAPEIDGHLGMTAVAAILGAYESAMAGRAVTMEEVLSGAVCAYQEDIDAALGLLQQ